MKRLSETSEPMAWLQYRPEDEAMTGFDVGGWSASTWVLHAMYENPALVGLGSHDDLHRRQLDSGEVAPLIIGDCNVDETTTLTGIPLGFVSDPGQPWVRTTWTQYLRRFPNFSPRRNVPPCLHWFPTGSWPVAIEPPPEGSLDDESLEALLSILADHSDKGPKTECFAFYGSLPASDFDNVHLWSGPLTAIPNLIDNKGGPYRFSPTNFWPAERNWFVWTDYDLQATKISGSAYLVSTLRDDPRLECVDWHAPTDT